MADAKNHDYHVLPPSPWPVLGALGAVLLLSGAVLAMHGMTPWLMVLGLLVVVYTMYVWWSDMVREANAGDHTPVVRIGLRLGFILFIISEVMFFSAWFWSFFKHAIFPMPAELGLTPTAYAEDGQWPPAGITTFDPWDLPLINTLILLLSGTTVTWAHHALIEGKRPALLWGLLATVLLGAIFTVFQAYEYSHASFAFSGNIYGANFYMATGFHGFHVIVGTLFLAVCLYRASRGGFTQRQHLGFEAAAWYWHFVDVVWLFLFAGIYIWGA
jgi:cytochrome c oxidase subunit 3